MKGASRTGFGCPCPCPGSGWLPVYFFWLDRGLAIDSLRFCDAARMKIGTRCWRMTRWRNRFAGGEENREREARIRTRQLRNEVNASNAESMRWPKYKYKYKCKYLNARGGGVSGVSLRVIRRLSGKPERQGVTDGPWKMEPRSPIEALQGT